MSELGLWLVAPELPCEPDDSYEILFIVSAIFLAGLALMRF